MKNHVFEKEGIEEQTENKKGTKMLPKWKPKTTRFKHQNDSKSWNDFWSDFEAKMMPKWKPKTTRKRDKNDIEFRIVF